MASTDTVTRPTTSNLQELARRHLWMHFTRMGAYDSVNHVPIIARARAPMSTTSTASATSTASPPSSASTSATAAPSSARRRHARSRSSTSTSSGATRTRAIELAERIASLTPATSTGSSSRPAARRRSRRRSSSRAPTTSAPATPQDQVPDREIAYHGTTLGALQATGIPALRTDFEPLVPGGIKAPNTNSYHWPEGRDPLWAADQIEEKILFEGPETVAAVILEPLQNAGGCIPPQDGYFQRVREICDRHDVLLVSDEVICAWGRLGHWFGCQRYDYQPDIVTTAKALTSAYAPMGAMIASERVYEPFAHGTQSFTHGFTFGGHPVAAAVALANLDIFEREDLNQHVLDKQGELRSRLDGLRDIPIVGDVRGDGFFHAIELVRDQETKEGSATRSPSTCCAASSPASSTAAGLSAGPTIAATR